MRAITLVVPVLLLAARAGPARVGNYPFNPAGNITCDLPIPNVMDCDDLEEWRDFRIKMQDYARRGFPVDMELFQQAMDLAGRYDQKDYPPQAFLAALCRQQGERSWPQEDRFCLYGFVSAMFVRARHMQLMDGREEKQLAQQDWVYSTLVLGKEGSVDFVDSSSWPINVLDAFININETEFMANFHYEEQFPILPRAIALEDIRWSPNHAHRYPVFSGFHPDATFGNHEGKKDLLVAVLGTHATLSNEPVTMISRFVNPDIKPVFYGLESRWCHLLQMCDHGDERLGILFKKAEKDPFGYPFSRLQEELRDVWLTDAHLRSSDLLLCTEPVIGCLILKQFAAETGRVMPLLGYMGVALMQGVPPTDVAQFWELFQSLVINDDATNPSVILSSNNLILSQQVFYQTGLHVPVVRAHGLYTGVSYAPVHNDKILMWRAPLFVYDPLYCAFEQFFERSPGYPFRFQQMPEGLSMPYKEVVAFRAVLLIPWDHALMTFYELYSMGIPLFMPAANWMYRFLYQRGQLSVGEPLYQSVMPGCRSRWFQLLICVGATN